MSGSSRSRSPVSDSAINDGSQHGNANHEPILRLTPHPIPRNCLTPPSSKCTRTDDATKQPGEIDIDHSGKPDIEVGNVTQEIKTQESTKQDNGKEDNGMADVVGLQ